MRLPARLAAAFLAVIAIGTAVSVVTIRVLAPGIFDRQMGMMNGRMPMGTGGGPSGTRAAFITALDQSLAVGGLVAGVLAATAALLLARSVLRPLDEVRDATRQIASGRYDVRVRSPREPDVATLAADVNTLAERLADTEARRMRLLGEVAHEMRTPLTGLAGYVEGLVDGVFSADDRTLDAMTQDLARLRRLAEDLSALSRSEEGRTAIEPVPCDLGVVVRHVCASLADHLRAVVLDVRVTGELPVLADPDRIGQVLTNLLVNAAQAQGPGTVTVVAGVAGGSARVDVRDSGRGLAPDDVERVFERFYRVPGGPSGDGTGIGLTIARGIARAHGGDVVAASAGPGTGATFTLLLPLAS